MVSVQGFYRDHQGDWRYTEKISMELHVPKSQFHGHMLTCPLRAKHIWEGETCSMFNVIPSSHFSYLSPASFSFMLSIVICKLVTNARGFSMNYSTSLELLDLGGGHCGSWSSWLFYLKLLEKDFVSFWSLLWKDCIKQPLSQRKVNHCLWKVEFIS